MFKLFLNETELTPVGIGAQKIDKDGSGEERLLVTFESELDLKGVSDLFGNLDDSSYVKIQNEKREIAYTGFTSMGDEIGAKIKGDVYEYTVTLFKKSTEDIVQQNTKDIEQVKADIEFLAAISDVEI